MATQAYEKYGRPVPPADPNADVMTVQESAYVLCCSVSHLRRFLLANPRLRSKSGRKVTMTRSARQQYIRMGEKAGAHEARVLRSAA